MRSTLITQPRSVTHEPFHQVQTNLHRYNHPNVYDHIDQQLGITLNKHSSLLHLPPLTNFFSQKPSYFGMWMTQRRHFPSLMSSKALLISSNGRLCVMNSSIWISCIKTVKLVQTSGTLYLKDTFVYR